MSALIRIDEVPAADRLEFIQGITSATWVPMECRSEYQADYWGEFRVSGLGAMRMVVLDIMPITVRRTPELISQADPDMLKLLLVCGRGCSVVEQDGRQARLSASDFAIYNTRRPYEVVCGAGLDADPVHVAMARQFAVEHGLGSVEVVAADARLPPGSFDLVHARTLLVNIPDPAEVLAEMTRLARPGGWVAGLEGDGEHSLCYPAHPAWDRLCEIFLTAFSRNGADPRLGRRLPELYRQAGLADVGAECVAPLHPAGHSRRTIRLDLVRGMRPVIVKQGIASEAELDELDHAVREHLADPDTLVMPFIYFMVWGRKPGGPSRKM